MRVTHVITRLIVGGAQENTIASVLGLRALAGIDAELISGPTTGPEGSLESAFASSREQLTILPELVRPVHPWKDFRAWRKLVHEFRQRQPQIVHTHSGKAGVLGRLAARRAGVPVIVHTIHGPSFGAFQGWFANSLFRRAECFAARCTTHFVVVADRMKEQYLAAGIARPDAYTKIYSGFDLTPYLQTTNDRQLRAALGLSPDDFVVGKIARLFKLKGHEELFVMAPQLVARCPRMKFLLVGDGEWRPRFMQMAESLKLKPHFVFAGLVPPDRVPAYLGIMDVLVHLSRREGLARALPQALAAGRPVVAYDCDGAAEVCRDGETGFLIKLGDPASLSRRLLQLADDEALRLKLGRSGQAFVSEHFSVEQMVKALHALYLRLTSRL